MYVQPLATETQRVSAYRSAQANYAAALKVAPAASAAQAAPTEAPQAPEQTVEARQADEKRIKFELLRRLHAASNAGTVKLRDVSRAFDESAAAV
ncbi:hypothetical protein [Litorisediminicola beolgyonensis]|uniref:Uncharacterized protein n=1 Tax=Litorisediminicola beolgyonensis TaxID=1173614 RepID=A0ABW3ZFZ4_9RHOB